MNLRSPKFWVALLSIVGVATMAIVDLRRSSPGPVAAAHAQVAKLHGGQSCRQCHGGLFSDMTAACLECHAPIAEQLDGGPSPGSNRGLHANLGKERGSQCALCHSEHHGADFALVNQVSFAQAGAGDPDQFDHATIGFAMDGAHLDLTCDQCHLRAQVAVLGEGQRRFLDLTQRCDACHFDAHRGRMQLDCATCHGQEHFHDLIATDHDRHLPLVGGHAGVSCKSCHPADDAQHSLEAVGAKQPHPTRQCQDCHQSPHADAFVRGVEQASPPAALGACAVCHDPEHTDFATAAPTLTAAQHAHSGYRLDAPHDQATCAQCHGPADATYRVRFAGRGPDDCRACHEDPHGGQFDLSPHAALGCVTCHSRTHFAPHEFTLDKHARTALALTGSHERARCDQCHVQPSSLEPRSFAGTPATCDACHADAHDGAFTAVAAQRPVPAHGLCAHCHRSTEFKDLVAPPFDHRGWTDFALRGAHGEAECQACHRAQPKDARGRTFARVADVFPAAVDSPPAAGANWDCARCHGDPHEGKFDGAALPRDVDGRAGCVRCHAESSFRALPHGFDHARWTGFALTGAHAPLDCAQCHAPLAQADEHGRTWARARGTQCADCHEDRHAGQFAVHGRNDCARCHKPDTFKALSFNHNLDARFKPGEAHAKVSCAACHKPSAIGDRQTVRYKPIAHECFDCHGMHEDQLRRRKKKGP